MQRYRVLNLMTHVDPWHRPDRDHDKVLSAPAARPETVMPPVAGLSQQEAQARLRSDGPNELPAASRTGALQLLWEVVREPMFLLLVACGAIYLALGHRHEALMLLGFVFVVIAMTFVQKRRSQAAPDALRDLSRTFTRQRVS